MFQTDKRTGWRYIFFHTLRGFTPWGAFYRFFREYTIAYSLFLLEPCKVKGKNQGFPNQTCQLSKLYKNLQQRKTSIFNTCVQKEIKNIPSRSFVLSFFISRLKTFIFHEDILGVSNTAKLLIQAFSESLTVPHYCTLFSGETMSSPQRKEPILKAFWMFLEILLANCFFGLIKLYSGHFIFKQKYCLKLHCVFLSRQPHNLFSKITQLKHSLELGSSCQF